MGLGFGYARSSGGRWNGSWQDFCLGGSSCDMQIADWESCYGVAAVNFVGEYPWRVGEYGTEWLSQEYWWRMGVVSIAETEFCASLPFRDPHNSTLGASSTDMSPWTNLSGHSARSGTDIQDNHRSDDLWNQLQPSKHVEDGKCDSPRWGSEQEYWWAGKHMKYPPCFISYHNIRSDTIKQWAIVILFLEFWDFWWAPSLQDWEQCGLANCDECENWIQTLSHSYTRIPFSPWPLLSDDVAAFRCAWWSRGWYSLEKHSADTLYSTVKILIHAIWTEDQQGQQNAVYQMIQIAKPWMIRRWLESKLADGTPLVPIPKYNAHLKDLKWTEDEQAKLKMLVDRYTSQGASGS